MFANDKTAARTITDKFRPQYPDDLMALTNALKQGLSGTSDIVENYERALSSYFDNTHAIALSSGAAALTVALAALDIKPGDEVVLTPTCPLCTVYPVLAAGAKPVFVDTRVDGFGIDLRDLDRVLNAPTKAVIDIPMWGYPTQVDVLQQFCRNSSVPLILDLAHAHGTTLHGRSLSAYGDLSCFSTHERKLLATGEGGFLLTNNPELAQRCRSFSRFGHLNGRDFGLNFKLAALPAALGQSRLAHLNQQLYQRRSNAATLLAHLRHPQVTEWKTIEDGQPNYYCLNLRLNFRDNRQFIDYLEANGVPSDIKRYGCQCLYAFPALQAFYRKCPNGEALLNSMTTIPVHPGITDDDIVYMANLINAYQAT